MEELYGHSNGAYSNNIGTSFNRANSLSRPSGKAIYRQRKEYSEALTKQDREFQHRVEHLLTCNVDGKEINKAEDCVERLKLMDAQSQVWGQDMLLQIKEQKLLLTDIEAEEELDSYLLECIQECVCILNSCVYNSILAITVKDMSQHRTSILLFQCEQIAADLLKTKIEKAIEEWKDERQNHDMLRMNLENMLYQQSRASHIGNRQWIPQDSPWPKQEQQPWTNGLFSSNDPNDTELPLGQQKKYDELDQEVPEPSEMIQDVEIETEILNHVLDDIESFVQKLQKNSSLNEKKKKKSKNRGNKSLPLKSEFEDCFQKIKYSFNLLGKLEPTIQQPSAPEFIQLIFSTLTTVLSICPWTNLASMVASPLLIPAAINLLRRSLNYDGQIIWKNLGSAWNLTRAEYPKEQSLPPYIPRFSDGWVPPRPTWRSSNMVKANGAQDNFSDRASDPPQLMRAMYDFHARNSQELTVRKGDLLEVLDQRKRWWLALNSVGEKGYIPNNIVEPVNHSTSKENSAKQVSKGFSDLQPSSSPAEVTVWLRTKGFSKITVKSLGILNGRQLLSMSQEELKTVCPEEGRRVFSMLSAVKATLQ